MRVTLRLFLDWLLSLLGRQEIPVEANAAEDAPEAPAIEPQVEAAKRPPRKRVERSIDLKSILEDLDATFKNLSRDVDSLDALDYLSKSDLIGLKKIGALVHYVPPGTANSLWEKPHQLPDSNAKLPSFFLIAVNSGGQSTGTALAPDFVYGLKLKKPPWNVTKLHGQAWAFGMGWRSQTGKIMWGQFYCYTRDGKIVPAHWLCSQQVQVPGGAYVKRLWAVSAWNPGGDAAEDVKNIFSWALATHCNRGDKWNVAANKGDMRAIFTIDAKDSAWAFKDRKVEALAADGKRKRIIHFVREHVQHREGKDVAIPAHIRGLRDFVWGGYKIFVTAPRFHVSNMADITSAAHYQPEGQDDQDDNFVPLSVAAKLFVAAEQEGNRRRPLH